MGRKMYTIVADTFLKYGGESNPNIVRVVATELNMSENNVRAQISYYNRKVRPGSLKHAEDMHRSGEILRKVDSSTLLNEEDGLPGKQIGEIGWRDIVSVASSVDNALTSAYPTEDEICIVLEEDSPIAIVCSADWHMGSHGVDYAAFMAKMNKILTTPQIYMGVVGDAIQNMPTSFRTALPVMNQVIPKKLQYKFLESIVEELISNNKLLFMTWGNHDVEFDERILGASVVELVISKLMNDRARNRYLPVGGFVNIKFAKSGVEYRFHVTHSYPGNSAHNPLYSNNKALTEKGMKYDNTRDVFMPVDATIQGHTHVPAFSHVPWNDRHIWHIKTGTYQEDGEYAARYFPTSDVVHFPTMVLNPWVKELTVFPDSGVAIDFVDYLNTTHTS